jgi:hypothetical protein
MSEEKVPRGWKKGFKIVTRCEDGKLRSMVTCTDPRRNPDPVYSDEHITRRKAGLEPFWVHTYLETVYHRLWAWPFAYELWECVYRPARDREDWPEHIGIGDAASAVRLTIKLAERLRDNGPVTCQPECPLHLG